MLRVRSLGSSGRQGQGFFVSSPFWVGSFGVQTIVPYPVDSSSVTVRGRISTGSADRFGDKQCLHQDVSGDLLSMDSSVITETTAPLVVNPAYVLVSGTLPSLTTWSIKRTNGSLTTFRGLLALVGCSGYLRVVDDVIFKQKSAPLKRTHVFFWDIAIDVAEGLHTCSYTYMIRTSTNGGLTWSSPSTTTVVANVAEYDLSSSSPVYRRYTSGVPSSWYAMSTVFKPCAPIVSAEMSFSDEIAGAFHQWMNAATPVQQTDVWGELCQSALQDARSLSINTGMYLYELATIAQSVKKTASLLTGKITPKTMASLYLTDRYGVRLTIADTKSVIDAASREMQSTTKNYSWVRSTHAESMLAPGGRFVSCRGSLVYHYKVYYDPYDHWFASSIKKLMDIDLFPTLTNVWDFVPLSFVLDWFVDIGSLFEKIDTRTYAATLYVQGTLSSTKRVVSGIPGSLFPLWVGVPALAGTWTCTSYQRTRSSTLILPRLILDQPRDFKNYAELTAIVATQLRS